jgi:hypothetical protein
VLIFRMLWMNCWSCYELIKNLRSYIWNVCYILPALTQILCVSFRR